MNEVFVDSGVFIHLFDYLGRSNTVFSYQKVKGQYDELLKHSVQLITTNFVVSETLNHISQIMNRGRSSYPWEWLFEFYQTYIINSATIYEVDNFMIASALNICHKYKECRYSFVDGSCFAFLEKHGFVPIFTTDLNWAMFNYQEGHYYKSVEIIGYVSFKKGGREQAEKDSSSGRKFPFNQ